MSPLSSTAAASSVSVPSVSNVPKASGMFLVLMLLVWLLAVVLAIWGTIHDGRRAERELRNLSVDEGPRVLDGVLNRWGLWSLGLALLGFVFLSIAAGFAH